MSIRSTQETTQLGDSLVMVMDAEWDNVFKSVITGGWANRSDGNVDAPTGAFALILIHEAEVHEMSDAFSEELSEAGMFQFPVGAMVAQENSAGIITVGVFASDAHAESYYSELESEFSDWDDEPEWGTYQADEPMSE